MLRSSFVTVLLVVLLLTSGPALGKVGGSKVGKVGISPGDSAVYSYDIFTTYLSPNGNISNSINNQMTIRIYAVNATGPVGEAGYTETLTIFNGTALNPPMANTSVTSIFDPFNNMTYFSQPWIGWYPFTYTDLSVGLVLNLGVNVTVTNIPTGVGNATQSAIERVNATVGRTPGLINVNFTSLPPGPNATQSRTIMRFNSTTGWLSSGVTYANAFGVEKIFTYQLVSYTPHTSPPDYTYVVYIVLFAIAVLVVFEVATRRSRSKRKASRMREKFTGKP